MRVGEVVISIFGHDMGEWYIVKQVQNDYLLLVDGKNKPLIKPKRKKAKHVVKANCFAEELAQKIAQGTYLQDAEVRKTLKFFKNNI